MEIQLFEGEKLISKSEDGSVTLTTHRIRYNSLDSQNGQMVSIMLEKISSIEIHYKSWTAILAAGVLFIIGGLFLNGHNGNDNEMLLGAGIGIVCIIIYFMTRNHVVTIASDGGSKIQFQTKGLKTESLLDFINKIELAKSNRQK